MKFICPFVFFYLENISNTKNLKIGVWGKQKKRINRNIKMHEQQNKINIIMIKKNYITYNSCLKTLIEFQEKLDDKF